MMTDEKLTDLILQFTSQLSELNTNMKSVLSKIADHETRLHELESSKTSLKDTAVAWLVKGLIASVLTVASLSGAGSLLLKFFGG